jgi:4-amino-4-deoxy-L-arabinose transferase-like glycosyltransferase
MDKIKQKEIVILLLCLLFGFVLRFYTFDQKSLWMDEIYTYNDSRDDLKGQIKFYKENPAFLHPPLFFVLTHLFYPFETPERDLRIIPLIFGTLSILMFYLLAKLFSPTIALPCTISLTLMAYHISLSQDGRSYSLLLFLGMAGLYFFMQHLQTNKQRYLLLVALCFSILFHTSYSSIPFIAFSQILWFYRPNEESKKPKLSSFFFLNGFILLLCLPWILFVMLNYKGDTIMDPLHTEGTGSLLFILYGVFHDWVPHTPLMIVSVILLILFPFFSENKKAALILLAVFILPIGGLYLFCKLFNITHFISSRYFINFLPLFLITLFISLNALEVKFQIFKRFMRAKLLFVILLIASNLTILPLYYTSQKQDFRGLVSYLKSNLRVGDKIFDGNGGYIPGILHYLGAHPLKRHHIVSFSQKSEKEFEYNISFYYQGNIFTIYHSKNCCHQYISDGNRLWVILQKAETKNILNNSPLVLKGYFDGSFLNFTKFPADASMYLFLWDPSSPDEKGIDMPIE